MMVLGVVTHPSLASAIGFHDHQALKVTGSVAVHDQPVTTSLKLRLAESLTKQASFTAINLAYVEIIALTRRVPHSKGDSA